MGGHGLPSGTEPLVINITVAVEPDRHGVVGAGDGAGHFTATELLIEAAVGHLHVIRAFRVALMAIIFVVVVLGIVVYHVIAGAGLHTEDTEGKLQQRARRDRERPQLKNWYLKFHI